ncbi:hypothetical protein BH23GEM3_BH23GEM3_22430 [soil metagenome]
MSAAAQWLRTRLPEAPTRLMDVIVGAVPAEIAEIPDALAAGALGLYGAVLHGSGCREDALALLAADALLTHAFQAQAELDPSRIEDLARAWGAEGRLGRLVGEPHA